MGKNNTNITKSSNNSYFHQIVSQAKDIFEKKHGYSEAEMYLRKLQQQVFSKSKNKTPGNIIQYLLICLSSVIHKIDTQDAAIVFNGIMLLLNHYYTDISESTRNIATIFHRLGQLARFNAEFKAKKGRYPLPDFKILPSNIVSGLLANFTTAIPCETKCNAQGVGNMLYGLSLLAKENTLPTDLVLTTQQVNQWLDWLMQAKENLKIKTVHLSLAIYSLGILAKKELLPRVAIEQNCLDRLLNEAEDMNTFPAESIYYIIRGLGLLADAGSLSDAAISNVSALQINSLLERLDEEYQGEEFPVSKVSQALMLANMFYGLKLLAVKNRLQGQINTSLIIARLKKLFAVLSDNEEDKNEEEQINNHDISMIIDSLALLARKSNLTLTIVYPRGKQL